MKNLNIAFSTDDRGVEMMLVAIYSIMRHHTPDKYLVRVYVIESGLSAASKQKIENLSTHFVNSSINYLQVDGARFSKYQLPQTRISQQAYYRYLLPELLPEELKLLYLDIDILCRGVLEPLYDLDISDYNIAATPSYSIENNIGKYDGFKKAIGMHSDEVYFNSGVLLMNLSKLREDSKVDEFLFNADANRGNIIEEKYDVFVDQTIANITFRSSTKVVSYVWNTLAHSYEHMDQDPVIVHYAGVRKPFVYKDMNQKIVQYMDEYLDEYVDCMAICNSNVGPRSRNSMLKQHLQDLYEQQRLSDIKQGDSTSGSDISSGVVSRFFRRIG